MFKEEKNENAEKYTDNIGIWNIHGLFFFGVRTTFSMFYSFFGRCSPNNEHPNSFIVRVLLTIPNQKPQRFESKSIVSLFFNKYEIAL